MSISQIHSTLACDPDFAELVSEFVTHIPARVQSIRNAMDENDSNQLKVLIHQLKGACGSYGFHPLTPLAAAIEAQLRSGIPADQLIDAIEEFVGSCLRMTADPV